MTTPVVMGKEMNDQKSDRVSHGDAPFSDKKVTQTEYLIRVRCEESADGSRSCKIQDISVDTPVMDQPLQKPEELSQKESTPAVTIAPATPVVTDTKTRNVKTCDLCNILSDMMMHPMKDVQPVPRRFTSWRRKEKILT